MNTPVGTRPGFALVSVAVLLFVLLGGPEPPLSHSPQLRLSPASGAPDSEVTASATGLVPGSRIALLWDGDELIARARVPGSGAVAIQFRVPDSDTGTSAIELRQTSGAGRISRIALVAATFIVLAPVSDSQRASDAAAIASPASSLGGAEAAAAPSVPGSAGGGLPSPDSSASSSTGPSSDAARSSGSREPVTGSSFPATARPQPASQPTPQPTQRPASPTPVPVAQPGTACGRVFDGDGSGSTDVTVALQSFVDSAPNNTVLCLRPGATYRLGDRISINRRTGLTIDGQGASMISPTARGTPFFYVNEGSGITFRNFVLEGQHHAAGTVNAHNVGLQHGHGIALEATRNVLIERVTMRRIFGDFVYIGTNPSWVWTDGVTIRNNNFALNGRMGIAVVAGRNILVTGNTIDKVGMFTFNIEPNEAPAGKVGGGQNVEFSFNRVGSGTHTNQFGPLFFAAAGHGNTTNVRVLSNTLTGQAMRVLVDRGPSQYVRADITISGNTSSVGAGGPVMRFVRTNGVTITNNVQPLSGGSLVQATECTNVTVSGNSG